MAYDHNFADGTFISNNSQLSPVKKLESYYFILGFQDTSNNQTLILLISKHKRFTFHKPRPKKIRILQSFEFFIDSLFLDQKQHIKDLDRRSKFDPQKVHEVILGH